MINRSQYVELHCHSNYSLLDGASPPKALTQRAAALNMKALALTDHDAVYGALRFEQAARESGIRPIFGAELTLTTGHHLTLLVENETGWANLCWLISQARRDAPKGSAALLPELLVDHTDGLTALSGCVKGEIPSALRRGNWHAALEAALWLRRLFGRDHLWIELQHHHLPEDDGLIYKLIWLARRIRVGYVATNNVHYATRSGQRLQDVLVCIRHGRSLADAVAVCRPNSEYFLKSEKAMRVLFRQYPGAITNTLRVAERCQFAPRYGLQDLPTFPTPEGMSAEDYLGDLCRTALQQRLPDPPSRVRALLAHELDLITHHGLANYFLIVADIVRYARENGIRCQGRGSSANSLVAYLLNISPINPLAHDLVFERFLSAERRGTPDIDIDFDAARREEVIQHVYEKYGHDHAAMACTLVTFRHKSAIRDVGKALGLPLEILDRRARAVHGRNSGDLAKPSFSENGHSDEAIWQTLDELCEQIIGFPRHLGIHNGGMVLMGHALSERIPTEPATMPNRVVLQWDKESLEDAGLVKIDILGLRMLSVVADTVAAVEQTTGTAFEIGALPFDDPAVFDMICRADTIGVFQVESRAQAQVLPHLRPRRFADLIVSISLIRPGPVQGNMVHPYLNRRMGIEPVVYPHPLLEPALRETLGIILFQEQVLKVARDLGQLTPGQGELLRRALGKGDDNAIAGFEAAFMAGAERNGVPHGKAAAIFGQLRAFGGYSFAKSHAAAFAVIVYQTAWLKYYYPVPFYVALLNNQPMGFWSPAVLVNDARRHGVDVLPVDIQVSAARCAVEGKCIRLGFNYVHGLGTTGANAIEAAREGGEFLDLADFCKRTRLPRTLIERLILIGAMDGWGLARRQLIWQLGELAIEDNPLGLIFESAVVDLPPLSHAEVVYLEYELLGLSPGEHVMALYRTLLAERGILGSHDLARQKDGSVVRAGGQVVMHQAPPTAKGHHFVTLEDEDGMINVIVRPTIYAEYAQIIRESPLLVVEGTVQKRGNVINLLAQRAAAMPV